MAETNNYIKITLILSYKRKFTYFLFKCVYYADLRLTIDEKVESIRILA